MIDLTHLKGWAWEVEYLSDIFNLIPQIRAVAFHWKSETLYRRWFPWLRSKYILDELIIPPTVDETTVVVILSDELYRIPKTFPALVVLKQYVPKEDKTSIPFPLGVRRDFPSLLPKPMKERAIDVGFVGRMYPHRKGFLTELSRHARLRSFRLALSCERRLGLAEFADFLNDSRISLCLSGNCSPETFRYFESLKMGCIVVTPKMPDNDLYFNHPGIQVGDMNNLDEVATVLQSVLEASEEHDALQQKSLVAWESQYSPRAMAEKILRAVELGKASRG